ncbi:MAG TPA: hypothetical protein VFN71_13675 [Methylomirabilota bacterium]|nr:hypothetical protein [Methylomirabilota bacterium]
MLGSDEFRPLALAEAGARGLPALPVVSVPHPIGGISAEAVTRKAAPVVPSVAAALLAQSFAPAAPAGAGASEATGAPDDLDAFQVWILERGWGDGLPVIPPTRERVGRMLAGSHRPPDEMVAVLPPRLGQATVERIAVNAVMAGALPEHLPVIVAAVEAVADPAFNLQAIQTTTHPCTPLVIVNGPVAGRLGINAAGNALGQGARANAAIGRALRLVLQNVGGARPGHEDRATHGHPGKYAYCFAEHEAVSPWEPLSVERGFAREDSTVTVCASEAPHNVNDHGSTTAEGILATVAGTAATVGMNNIYLGGEPLILLGPEHAATVAAAGWSKADFKRALWQAARVPLARFSAENLARFATIHPEGFKDRPAETLVPIARDWRDLMVVVAGGAGKHSAVIPTFGATRSVTRRIDPAA